MTIEHPSDVVLSAFAAGTANDEPFPRRLELFRTGNCFDNFCISSVSGVRLPM